MFHLVAIQNLHVVYKVSGVGKWLNATAYVSVIRGLVVNPRSILYVLTIHPLSVCHFFATTKGTDWFTKGRVMYYHVYVIMHDKDPISLS